MSRIRAVAEGAGIQQLLSTLLEKPGSEEMMGGLTFTAKTPEMMAELRAICRAQYPEVKEVQQQMLQAGIIWHGTAERMLQFVLHLEGLKAEKVAAKA